MSGTVIGHCPSRRRFAVQEHRQDGSFDAVGRFRGNGTRGLMAVGTLIKAGAVGRVPAASLLLTCCCCHCSVVISWSSGRSCCRRAGRSSSSRRLSRSSPASRPRGAAAAALPDRVRRVSAGPSTKPAVPEAATRNLTPAEGAFAREGRSASRTRPRRATTSARRSPGRSAASCTAAAPVSTRTAR